MYLYLFKGSGPKLHINAGPFFMELNAHRKRCELCVASAQLEGLVFWGFSILIMACRADLSLVEVIFLRA